jgi:predicted transcriptional regulator
MTAQDYLKAIRQKDKALTQVLIAEKTGIAQSTISKIEGGQEDVLASTYLALKKLYDEVMAAEVISKTYIGPDRRTKARA